MVTIRRGLSPDQIAPAARLYWEAFGGKLGTVMGPEPRALRFVALAMQPDHCFSATGPDGRLLGIAGFKSPFGAFVGGHSRDLRAAYGVLGAVWRSAALVDIVASGRQSPFSDRRHFRHAGGTRAGHWQCAVAGALS